MRTKSERRNIHDGLRGEHRLLHLVAVPAHRVGDLVADQAVPHELAGVDDEVLAVRSARLPAMSS